MLSLPVSPPKNRKTVTVYIYPSVLRPPSRRPKYILSLFAGRRRVNGRGSAAPTAAEGRVGSHEGHEGPRRRRARSGPLSRSGVQTDGSRLPAAQEAALTLRALCALRANPSRRPAAARRWTSWRRHLSRSSGRAGVYYPTQSSIPPTSLTL